MRQLLVLAAAAIAAAHPLTAQQRGGGPTPPRAPQQDPFRFQMLGPAEGGGRLLSRGIDRLAQSEAVGGLGEFEEPFGVVRGLGCGEGGGGQECE